MARLAILILAAAFVLLGCGAAAPPSPQAKRAADERDCITWVVGRAVEEERRLPMSDADSARLIRSLGDACMRAKGY